MTPSGLVTFIVDGTNTLGIQNLNSNGSATLPTYLAVGPHSLTALYSGDSNYVSVDSNTVTVVVSNAPIPQIGSINPNYGAASALITVTGTDFGAAQGSGSVTVGGIQAHGRFYGIPAHVVSWSNTAIAIQVPSNGTTGNIIVTTSGGASNGPSPSILIPLSPKSHPRAVRLVHR